MCHLLKYKGKTDDRETIPMCQPVYAGQTKPVSFGIVYHKINCGWKSATSLLNQKDVSPTLTVASNLTVVQWYVDYFYS